MAKSELNFSKKFFYGVGSCADVLMANLIFNLAYPIYQDGLGLDPRLIGLAIGIPRLWDAITDPFIGNFSDNLRTRWGRRRPFIFVGAILTGILCMMMWAPPNGSSPNFILGYFFAISVLFFTTYTVFSVPYNALGYEMSGQYDERTNLMSYKVFLTNLGATLLLPLSLKMCLWFGETIVEGARFTGVIFGIFMIGFGIVPAIYCRERRQQKQDKISMVEAVKFTVKNKPFLIACGVIIFSIAGVFIASPLQFYINMGYIVSGSEEKTAHFVMLVSYAYGIFGFSSIPLINWSARKFGKKIVLQCGLAVVGIGMFMSWFYYTPANPYLQLFYALAVGPGMNCAWVLLPSMIADICDLDELQTGRRREGMFGAVFTLLMKASVAFTMMLSGCIISWTGYNKDLLEQTQQTITRLRAMSAFAPVVLVLIAIVLACFFPLSKAKVLEVQKQLKDKKMDAQVF